jgi:hypothetical protein
MAYLLSCQSVRNSSWLIGHSGCRLVIATVRIVQVDDFEVADMTSFTSVYSSRRERYRRLIPSGYLSPLGSGRAEWRQAISLFQIPIPKGRSARWFEMRMGLRVASPSESKSRSMMNDRAQIWGLWPEERQLH